MRRSFSTSGQLLTRLTGLGLGHSLVSLGRIGRARRARAAQVDPIGDDLATVSSLDDPDGSMRLIQVSGLAELATMRRLAATIFDAPIVSVHIDLTDVAGWMPDALTKLEAVLDEAEHVGFRIRVIGLDPAALLVSDQMPR